MHTNKLTYLICIVTILFYSCGIDKVEKSNLSFEIKDLRDSTKIHLLSFDQPKKVFDSAYVINEKFDLSLVNGDEGLYFIKVFEEKPYIFDFWHEGKNLTLREDPENNGNLKVLNSPKNDFIQEYRNIPDRYEHLLLEADEKSMDETWEKILPQINADQAEFLLTKPNFLFSLREIISLNTYISTEKLRTFYNDLNNNLKNTKEGKLIASYLERNRVAIGEKYLDFSGFDVDGNSIKLSDFEGKIILLDFMANWCMPCHAQNKEEFTYLHKKYKDELVIVTYSLDEEMETWKKSVAKDSYQWTSITNLKGLADEVAFQYRIDPLPHSFLIDRNGIIRNEFIGYNKDNRIEDFITEILNEK